MSINDFMRDIGYDIDRKGGMFFIDLMGHVVELQREGKSVEDIKEIIPRYFIEYYHFCYEISRFEYLKELELFCKKGYILKSKGEKKKRNESIEDKLIRLSKRYIKNQKMIEINSKIYKKTIV